MRIKIVLILGVLVFLGLIMTERSFAAIYKYVDQEGMVCFTNDLQSIPENCRATAKIVSADEEEKPAVNQNQQAGAGSTAVEVKAPPADPALMQAPAPPAEPSSFPRRVLISFIVVVSAVFAFIILGVLDLDHKKAIMIIRVVILWGMTVYLLFAHLGDVFRAVGSIGNRIETVQQDSAERGRKAAKAMKALDAMMDDAHKLAADPEADLDKRPAPEPPEH